MRNSIGTSSVFGVLVGVAAITCAYADPGRELLVSAPVQQVDRGAEAVTVLGQVFHAPTDQMSVGEIVNVYGVLNKDGSITDAVVQGTQSYGANGDPVFVKGVVTGTDTMLGYAKVDGLTIDYTAELANPDFAPPSVGDVIAVAASEPVQKGMLVATATGDGAYSAGISGGGTSIAGMSSGGVNGGGIISAGVNGGGMKTAGMSGGGR